MRLRSHDPCRISLLTDDFVVKVFWSTSARGRPENDSCQAWIARWDSPGEILSADPSIRRQSDFCNKIRSYLPQHSYSRGLLRSQRDPELPSANCARWDA